MTNEDQELVEIEKMLESMSDTTPPPSLRGETLNRARHAWQKSKNFSYRHIIVWAAAALLIFSLGYFIGMNKKVINNDDDINSAGQGLPKIEKEKQKEGDKNEK